jgi:predicted nucleotidyltransferase
MRASPSTAADVLFGKGRGAILGLLYEHPDESFYYRQLTRELGGVSPGTLQRELDTLAGIGLIERSTKGNQVFYRANRSHPVFPELRSLVAKTVGTIPLLRSKLASLSDHMTIAFVYGSMARQEERAESDIDLMVIGTATLEEVLAKLGNVETSLRRAVNPVVYSPAEFKKKLNNGNHFLNSVIRGQKVFLFGDEDELRKMGGIRLAESRSNQPGRN